jgi:threonine synthase
MKYRSTRGGGAQLNFCDTVLAGLADDGGLYVPEEIPTKDAKEVKAMSQMSYNDLAYEVMRPFIPVEEISDATLKDLVARSYASFSDPRVAPVRKVGPIYVQELFHGPTLAFKDVALQFLGNVFELILNRTKGELRILGATSGDTGSAAIYGVRGKPRIECVILYPDGRTSKVQEMQMATVEDPNIQCCAVAGTFDDCQNIVKDLFKSPLKKELSLGAVNSINWCRILAQVVYYWYAAFRVQEEVGKVPVNFSVPTGNFGDILAGYYAKMMGAPIGKLIIASNSNDILTRFFETGKYEIAPKVLATMSPSMDIGISSNFERFLYYLWNKDTLVTRTKFTELSEKKAFGVTASELQRARETFLAERVSEEQTIECIGSTLRRDKYLLCPHSAIGYAAAERYVKSQHRDDPCPIVALATAHWGKFVESMQGGTQDREILDATAELPPALAKLKGKPLRRTFLAAKTAAVERFLVRRYSSSAGSSAIPFLFVASAAVAVAAIWYYRSK